MTDGDFNPDAHPPIRRDRCLATAWYDDDCMPAVCRRDWGHVGAHQASLQQCRMPTPEWVDEAEEDVA